MSDFTWTALGRGLVGAAVGGVLECAGILGSTIIRAPKTTKVALKSLVKTEKFGPVLKTTLAPAVIIGGVCSPVITGLAGLLYGISDGFVTGAVKGIGVVPSKVGASVQRFHTELVDTAIDEVVGWTAQKPERVYEIKIIEAVKAPFTATYGGVVYCAGVAFCAAVNVWGFYGKLTRALWESRSPFPFMVGGQVILTAATPVAIALLVAGALLGGIGYGVYTGYSKGLMPALTGALADMRKLNIEVFKYAYIKAWE